MKEVIELTQALFFSGVAIATLLYVGAKLRAARESQKRTRLF